MLGKGRSNPYTQLVGWQTGATIVEVSVDNSQKAKNRYISDWESVPCSILSRETTCSRL